MAQCPKCGAERQPGATECPQCGIIYAKAEQIAYKRAVEERQRQEAKKKRLEEESMKERVRSMKTAEESQAKKQQDTNESATFKLVSCPACGHQVSINAAACPKCGEPVQQTTKKVPKRKGSKFVDGNGHVKYSNEISCGCAILLFIVLPICLFIFSPQKSTNTNQQITVTKVENCFSAWDGSHRELTEFIKKFMNDPKSYEHIETKYWDMKDHLVVLTRFRGKNAFGGVVVNAVKAKTNRDTCQIIEIIETFR